MVKSDAPSQKAPKVRFYRNIVATFVALNVILLIFVLYLSFVKAEITVYAAKVPRTAQFSATVTEKPSAPTDVSGIVVVKNFEDSKEVAVAGAVEVPGKAKGTITVVNTTSKPQTLIERTRFIPEGKTESDFLYRLQKTVVVPANGSMDVTVVSEYEGTKGDIDPGKFFLPGLPPAMQKQIYGESKTAFTGGVHKVAKVTEKDMDAAAESLSKEMYARAEKTIEEEVKGNYTGEAYTFEVLEKRSDAAPGSEVGEFTISIKLRVVGVFYDKQGLLMISREKLFESLSDDLTLRGVEATDLTATLASYDAQTGTAVLKISAKGTAVLKEGGPILGRNKLTGRNVTEAVTYLKSFDEVRDVKIRVQPFWLKTLPKLKDHIEIKIVE